MKSPKTSVTEELSHNGSSSSPCTKQIAETEPNLQKILVTEENGSSPTNPCNLITEMELDHHGKIAIFKCNRQITGLSSVYDYICQPPELDSICLYDWISWYQHEKKSTTKSKKPARWSHTLLQFKVNYSSDSDSSIHSNNEYDGPDMQLHVSKLPAKS